MKRAFPLLPLALTGACLMPGKATPSPLCNFSITDTSAWVNMMPGPGGPPRNLTVVVEIEDDGMSRRFEPQGVDENGTLKLDVVEWGPKEGLGKIVYRTRGHQPERVEIFCDGDLITSTDVTTAQ